MVSSELKPTSVFVDDNSDDTSNHIGNDDDGRPRGGFLSLHDESREFGHERAADQTGTGGRHSLWIHAAISGHPHHHSSSERTAALVHLHNVHDDDDDDSNNNNDDDHNARDRQYD